MRLTTVVFAATTLIAIPAAAFAQGASSSAPGQKMQEKGPVSGSPGASGYAPGQKMQESGSKPGTTGASGYAPGHSTSGSGMSTKERDDTKMKSK